MNIQKEQLQNALEIVKPGLSNQEIIEQSTSFAFLGDRVVTYNDMISLSHPIEGLNLTGAIRAEELYEFLKRSKQSELQVKTSENELLLKSGKAKAGLALQTEIKLPLDEVGVEKDWIDVPDWVAGNLNFVKDSCSRDMSRRVLTCVHVSENMLESSDGFQIMRVYRDENTDPWPFENTLIPAEIISEMHKVAPTQIAQTDGWLHFKNPDGTELSCRVLMDSYPETGDHFDVKGEQIVFPESMTEILERAWVFAKKEHALDEELEIRLKGNTLMVEGKNAYGWFKEQAAVKYEGDEAKFSITPTLLINILKKSNTCLLGTEKIKFEGQGWEYVAVLKN